MKKGIVLLLAGALAVSMVACSKKDTVAVDERGQVSADVEKQDDLSVESEMSSSEIEMETEETEKEIGTEEIETEDVIEGEVELTETIDEPEATTVLNDSSEYTDGQEIYLDSSWTYAENSMIHSGCAIFYKATSNRKNIIVGVNAGHGTSGGSSVKTLCHPDGSAKTTGGSTAAGSTKAIAVSGGMTFNDGTSESSVTLREAQILRDKLLEAGYDVLMIRDGEDVQLDNVARTVICNNVADCHIAIHWDGDGLNYDKGCFYCSVPDGIKNMEPTASIWQEDDALGEALIEGLTSAEAKINGSGSCAIDLTQTSYSTVPSTDIELGNACSDHSEAALEKLADGLLEGIDIYFDK